MDSEVQVNNFPPNTYSFEFVGTLEGNLPHFTDEEHDSFRKDFSKAIEEVYKKYGVTIKVWKDHPEAAALADLTPSSPPKLSEL